MKFFVEGLTFASTVLILAEARFAWLAWVTLAVYYASIHTTQMSASACIRCHTDAGQCRKACHAEYYAQHAWRAPCDDCMVHCSVFEHFSCAYTPRLFACNQCLYINQYTDKLHLLENMWKRTELAVDMQISRGNNNGSLRVNILQIPGSICINTERHDVFNVLEFQCTNHPGEIVYQACCSIAECINALKKKSPNLFTNQPQERCDIIMTRNIVHKIADSIQRHACGFLKMRTADLELVCTAKILLKDFVATTNLPAIYGIQTFDYLTFFQFEYAFDPVDIRTCEDMPMQTCDLLMAVDTANLAEMNFFVASSFPVLRDLLHTRYSCNHVSFTKKVDVNWYENTPDIFRDRDT